MTEVRVLGSFPIVQQPRRTVYLIAGFGWRWLEDNMFEKSEYGYKRESRYYYWPVAAMADFALKNGDRIQLWAEYDIFRSGLQKSHLENANMNHSYNEDWIEWTGGVAENKQKKGEGIRLAVTWNTSYGKTSKWRYSLSAFLRYWHILDSEILDYAFTYHQAEPRQTFESTVQVLEPENKTVQFGVMWRLISPWF